MLVTEAKREDGKRVWRAEAENLMDLEHWLANTPANWLYGSSQSGGRGTGWDLGVDYAGALRLARDGWSEGARDLNDRLAVNMPALDSVAKWTYDVAGERPDVGRFLSGEPAHMMRHGHPKGQKPVITLAISTCISAGVEAKCLTNYGAALVAIIDKLEHANHRVEVIAGWCNNIHYNARVAGSWIAKRAEDPVDLGALAFSLAHPAASRRLGFAIVERCPFQQNTGYGCSQHEFGFSEPDFANPARNTFYIPALGMDKCRTMDSALIYVRNQINLAAGETLVEVE